MPPPPLIRMSFLLGSATSRLLVQSKIYDEVVSAVVERAKAISIGNPMRRGEDAPGPCMGPLVSASQRDRVLGFVKRVREERFFHFLVMKEIRNIYVFLYTVMTQKLYIFSDLLGRPALSMG